MKETENIKCCWECGATVIPIHWCLGMQISTVFSNFYTKPQKFPYTDV